MKTYETSDEEKKFLAGYDLTKYDRPSVAADVVVHIKDAGLCLVGSAKRERMS